MNKTMFKVGEVAEFFYHDKLRMGVVETVAENFVRLDVKGTDDDPAATFKSFSYNKIVPTGVKIVN